MKGGMATSVSMKIESKGKDSRTSSGSAPRDARPRPSPSLSWISILRLPGETIYALDAGGCRMIVCASSSFSQTVHGQKQ